MPFDSPARSAATETRTLPSGRLPRREVGRNFVDWDAGKAIASAILRHATPRRLGVLATYVGAWSAGRSIASGLQQLDEVFHRGWREQKVEQPVFIFATPRSGTTLLHRLMSFDDTHFVGPKLYETVFPSASLIRGIHALGRLDERLPGRPFRRMVAATNQFFIGDTWDGIHKIGFDEPEEDEPSFVYAMHTPTALLMVPQVEELENRFHFDELPDETRARFLDAYEGVLKRLLYAHGGERRYLNKNVFFVPRVRTILDRFPDARCIYVVRHPYEALPSFLNMFTSAWRVHSPEIAMDGPEVAKLVEIGCAYYRIALDLIDAIPRERLRVVRYDDLVSDPKATVESVYRWLELPVTEELDYRLEVALRAQRSYESQHDYSLATFGLTEDVVYEKLRPVFERFRFARHRC